VGPWTVLVIDDDPVIVKLLQVNFEIEGQRFTALNGGPHFKLNEAFSIFVSCDTQEEVDDYWNKLIDGGGVPSRCGWLKDKYGLSWQIIPKALMELMSEHRSQRLLKKGLLRDRHGRRCV